MAETTSLTEPYWPISGHAAIEEKDSATREAMLTDLPVEMMRSVAAAMCPQDCMVRWADACRLGQTCKAFRDIVLEMPTFQNCHFDCMLSTLNPRFNFCFQKAPVVAVSCAAARAGSSVDGFDGHLRHRAARLQHAEPAAVAALHPSTGYLTPSGLRIGSGGTADEVGLVLDNGN